MKSRKWSEQELAAVRRIAVAQAAGDDSRVSLAEIPRLTPRQLSRLTKFRERQVKVPVSVRLDAEVLAWLKSKGAGHLTRINDILANLMDAERRSA